jgi:hypothetical protein
LTSAFGNTLPLHRAVNGIFLLASCVLCFLLTYRGSRSISYSVAAGLIFYAGLLHYSTPIAGPNGLGLFLFLSGLCIPWFFNFSNRSLAAALVLGVMAFYAKQYFVACLGYLALYMFIAVSKKKAIIFGVFSSLIFLASLILVTYTSPYFLIDTIGTQGIAAAIVSSNRFLLNQLLEYGKIYLPILGILAILGSLAIWNKRISASSRANSHSTDTLSERPAFFNLGDYSAPLVGRTPDYIWFCFICSLVVIVLKLGKHPGNNLTYLFQLMSPFLIAGTLISASKSTSVKWLHQLFLISAFYTTYSILPRDFSVDHKNWDRLSQVVSEAATIYASPIVLADIVASGAEIYYNGSTVFFPGTVLAPSVLQKKDPEKSVDRIWEKYVHQIYSMIEHQDFDVLVLEKFTAIPDHIRPDFATGAGKALLEKHYQRTEVVKVSLAKRLGGGKWAMEVWRPRPDTSPSKAETDFSDVRP